jgi:hypothetical protein
VKGESKRNEEERHQRQGQSLKPGFIGDGIAGSLLFPLGHQAEIK